MSAFVYILKSARSGRYYIGSTENLAQRVEQHNAGMMKSTRPFRPWRLVYLQEYETLSEARRREREIKSWKSPTYMKAVLALSE